MEFTSLFIENLFSGVTVSLNPLSSVIPTSVSSLGSATTHVGAKTISISLDTDDGISSSLMSTTGSGVSYSGSTVSSNAFSAYEQTVEDLKMTQAYMESLNQEELETLIAKLEIKNTQFFLENDEDSIQKRKTNI